MIVSEIQSWRRPIDAHAEETYDLESGEPKRSIMWYLKGKYQREDADRLARGLACGVCLSTFPARPELATVSIWKQYANEWYPMRTKDELIGMVSRGLCPSCASEVRQEMHEVMHRGLDPLRPKGMDS